MEKNKRLMKRIEFSHDDLLNNNFDKLWPHFFSFGLSSEIRDRRINDLKKRIMKLDPQKLIKN